MFDLSQEQKNVRAWARDFAEREVAPFASEMDGAGTFRRPIIDAMFEAGVMGMTIPGEYGGKGASSLEYITAVEELARCDASTALVMSIHSSLCAGFLAAYGGAEMKTDVLPALASGSLGAFALTERDPGSPTKAPERGESFVISGTKMYITNGPVADLVVVIAVTGEIDDERNGKPAKRDEMSALLVEAGKAHGLSRENIEGRLGLRAAPVGKLEFADVSVPKRNMIGERGAGMRAAMRVLDGGRIGAAAMAVGVAQASIEAARRYALDRVTQGRPIAKFQAVQLMIGEMATRLEAARALTYQAASMMDRGEPYGEAAAQAKLFAAEAASFVTSKALEIHGGAGVVGGFHPVERLFRDARVLEIIEGTSEMQKLLVAGHELRKQPWGSRQ